MSEINRSSEKILVPIILGGTYEKIKNQKRYILTEKSTNPDVAIFSILNGERIDPNSPTTEKLLDMRFLNKTLSPEEMLKAISLGYKSEYKTDMPEKMVLFYKEFWGIK